MVMSMSKGSGKRFEEDFKKSVPSHCLLVRLNDPPQSFGKSDNLRFSMKNPCDFMVFDSERRIFMCLELKTTSGTSMSFENIHDKSKTLKMIHAHQTKSLLKFSQYDYVYAGFLLNFRKEKCDSGYDENTYFIDVNVFQDMCDDIDKKSFNEKDLIEYGATVVSGKKKRTRFIWNIDKMIDDICVNV